MIVVEPMSTVTAPVPRVSVVVRSYNRLAILPQLLEALLAQDHDSFEIVVVEQSTKRPPEAVVRVDELARDPRVRMVRAEPLGGPRARNVGVRATRGEIVVLIDDDDLPSGSDWLRSHEANYGDPRCLGVSGRHLGEDDDASEEPYANMDKARRCVLSFNVLKFQRCYVCTDRRKQVESLHGTNASIRRSALERFGLWDECTPIEDEPSFAFRFSAMKRPDEYLVFDPEVTIIRRLDEPGGMDKRGMSALTFSRRIFTFLHNIVGHYFPVRFWLLYPAYYAFVGYQTTDWILNYSRRHTTWPHKLVVLAALYLVLPVFWIGWLGAAAWSRLRRGKLAHHPTLSLHTATAVTGAARRLITSA
jgi:glycosyltransferase involved in cell wall biosynthesis